ncbi:branched-chain-amino-acid aminotransferase [Colletotrichum karsti]|uniref:Branched-chain-amino-acid aminotransferase n=1 Tax=Colletotrichum karsti TaxID=1095194 RepID=A0A9P6LHK8_9PEZI|nr:branched-chain-amino-acid aminotransferase [Colletotrichum karsti]KAF9873688.1 branched-chain-amino-acid aminotransferase [Colletotrichum karsti]
MDDLNKVVGASLSVSSKTAAVGFICLFVAGIIVVFKRLVLHPLGRYPGPLIGRLTSLYNTYHAFRKDQARNLHQLHEKYGPIVRYGPNHVSIRSAEGVKMLYTNSRYTRKADNYLAFPRNPEKASLFSSINKQVHARKRRILRQGFSDSALKTAGVTIKKHVATLCQCLEFLDNDKQEGYILSGKEKSQPGSWSKPKNFSEWINRFTFDVSSDLSFSKSFEMMRYAGNRHIIKILHETLWADNVTGSSLTLLHKLRLKWLLFLYHVRSTVTFDTFIEKAAGERVSKISESKKDFMFWLTGAVDPVTGDTFTMEELVEEAILLITAGSDTSSTAISSTIYYLLHSPDKLARLQKEVRSVFTSIDQIEFGTELQACTYLRACINEGLRLSPPAGSVLHRQVEPGGVQVGDQFYPEGVNIGVPVFSIHHDKEYFPDPFSFQPERWIVGETLADGTLVTPEFLKSSSGAFMAFSAGTRSWYVGRAQLVSQVTNMIPPKPDYKWDVYDSKKNNESRYDVSTGLWSGPEFIESPVLSIHGLAPGLHYGQQVFEGLQARRNPDGDILIFRPDANAARMRRSAAFVSMPEVPDDLFLESVQLAVRMNGEYVCPHEVKGSLYIRPFQFGSSAQIGLDPPDEFLFCVFVQPHIAFHGHGAIKALVLDDFDRAATRGSGAVKVGGNYAPVIRWTSEARKEGYNVLLHLDSQTQTEIDEFSTSGFLGLQDTDGAVTLVVATSKAAIESITADCAAQLAATFGWNVQRRAVSITT